MKINVSAKKWQTATSKRSWMKLAAHIASHYPKDKALHAAVRGMFKSTDAAVSRYGSSVTKKRSTSKPRRAAKRRSAPKRRSTAKRRAPAKRRSTVKRRTARKSAPKRRTAARRTMRRSPARRRRA